MTDSAALAAMSDPDLNRHFRRRWFDPYPRAAARVDPRADPLLSLGIHLHLAGRAAADHRPLLRDTRTRAQRGVSA